MKLIEKLIGFIKKMRVKLRKALVFVGVFLLTVTSFANPELTNTGPGVTVSQTPTSTVVNQESQRAILNWRSFNIGEGESTHFQQPQGGIALNRIDANQGVSQIYGHLSATGQIILLNSAGIHFGPNSVVNVGGMIAATANLSDQNFMSGNYQFTNPGPSGSIINEGQITAAEHGLVALVAPEVINKGVIQANLGNVILASGNAFTINFDGNNLINFALTENAEGPNHGVSNTGTIIADGGKVLVSAKAAAGVLDNVINMEGVVQARSVRESNGEIILGGDQNAGVVRVAAKIDASGRGTGQHGGKVTITGHRVLVEEPTVIDVSGDIGGGDINIGGSLQGRGPLPNSDAVVVGPNTLLLADAGTAGNGGNVIVWSDNLTKAYGSISARGGEQSGNGGFIETSSHGYLDVNGIDIDTRAPYGKNGQWLLDPASISISSTSDSNITSSSPFKALDNSLNASVLDITTLLSALSSDVTVQTVGGGTGTAAGDITVDTPISWSQATTLTLSSFHDINFNFNVSATSGTLSLNAGNLMTVGSGVTLSPSTLNVVTSGTLQMNGANGISSSTTMNISSGTVFDMNGFNQTVGSIAGAGNITLSGTLSEGINGNSTTLSGIISGPSSGGLTKQGTGTLTLSGANTFDGATIVAIGGTLVASNATALGSTVGSTSVASGATLEINNVNIGTEALTVRSGGVGGLGALVGTGTATAGGDITLPQSVVFGGTGTLTLSGTIIGTNRPITKVGTGTLVISGTNNNTGAAPITLSNGILSISNDAQLGAITHSLTFNGGTLATTGTFTLDATRSSTFSSTGNFQVNSGTLTYNGAMSGAGGLTKSGSGTMVIGGSNSYSGQTTVSAGTLANGVDTAIPNTTTLSVSPSATYDLNGFAQEVSSISGTGTITNTGSLNSFTITPNSSPINFSGLITGNISLVKSGTQSLTLSTANTYTGETVIASGTLLNGIANALPTGTLLQALDTYDLNGFNQQVAGLTGVGTVTNSSGAAGTFTVNNTSSNTFDGVITGNLALTKSGAGTLTLTNDNTFSGNTNINAGILNITDGNGLSGTSSVIVASGGEFDISNFDLGNTFTLSLAGTGASGNGAFYQTASSGTASYGGAISLTANATIGTNSGSTLQLSGDLTNGGFTPTFSTNGGTISDSGQISGTGGLTVTGTSSGTLNLSGSNNYTGTTTISSGKLQVGAVDTLPTNTAVILADVVSAILDLSLFNQTIGSLAGGGSTGGNVTLGSNRLTTGDASSTTYAGVISGRGGITKQGSGTLTLSGTNTYGGSTIINAGAISIGADSGLGTAPTLVTADQLTLNGGTLATSATFALNGNRGITLGASGGSLAPAASTTLSYNGIITGSGNFTKAGSGLLKLGGVNTYTGATNINLGTLQVTANNVLPSTTAVTLANASATVFELGGFNVTIGSLAGGGTTGGNVNLTDASLTTGDASNTTYSGLLNGNGGLIKQGSGKFTLDGANSYTGTTTINDGTLSLNASNTLPATDVSIASPGTLELQMNISNTIANLSGAGAVTLALGSNLSEGTSTNSTYSGLMSGDGTFTKQGTGVLILGGAGPGITINGTVALNQGTIRTSAANSLSVNTAFNIAASGTFDLNNFDEIIGSLNGLGNITLGSGTLTTQSNADSTFSGVISGTGGLTKQGNNTLTLAGTNTYGGTTSINAGKLQLGASNVIDDASPVTLANVAGAIFDLNGFNDTIASLAGGGGTGGNVTLGSGNLTTGGNNSSTTYSGVLSGSGQLVKTGSGTFTLAGPNTYSGATSINGGAISISADSGLGTAPVAPNATQLTLNGGALATTASFTLNSNRGINLGASGGTLQPALGTTLTYNGIISNRGNLTKAGGGTLTLGGVNTYSGNTNINDGTLKLGTSGVIPDSSPISIANLATAFFDLNGVNETIGSLAGGGTTGGNVLLGSGTLTTGGDNTSTIYGGVISGSGNLTKQGNGTFTLAGNNIFNGTTNINTGTISVTNANALGTVAGSTIVASGATLDINGVSVGAEPLTIGGAGVGNAGALTGTGTSSFAGDISLTSTATIGGTGTLTLSGAIDDGAQAFNLNKAGTGTLILSGVNTYGGNTNLNEGTLKLGASDVIPDSSAVTLSSSTASIFDLDIFDETIASLAGGLGFGEVKLGIGTLTTGDASTTIFSGIISGFGNLDKEGTGTFTLAGANTYEGGTLINAGTVQLTNNDALGSTNGGTSVAGGATLSLIGVAVGVEPLTLTGAGVGGGGALTGTGTNSYSGNITLAGDTTIGGTGTMTLSGDISETRGVWALTKVSSGTLVVSGPNTYTGGTTINGGVLQLGAGNVMSDVGAVVLANVAGVSFDLNNFTDRIGQLSGGGTTGGNVTLGSGTLITGNSGGSTTYSGVISGTGGSIIKEGTGTFTLAGTNTYSGSTTINEGKLQLGASGVISDSSAVSLANTSGAILDLNNFNETIASLSGGGVTGGNVTLGTGGGGTLTAGDSSSTTYSGVISGTGGFTKIGSGTLTLGNTSSYTGATTISAGAISLRVADALPNLTSLTVASGATFNVSAATQTVGSLTGGGNVVLGTAIPGGASPAIFTIGNNSLSTAFSGIISEIANSASSLIKLGTGTLTLSGTNTYTGATTVSSGTLSVTNAQGLGTTAGGTSVSNGATLNINGVAVGNETVTLGNSTLSSTGTASLAGPLLFNTGTNPVITANAGSNFTLSGDINGAGALALQGTGSTELAGDLGTTTRLSSLTTQANSLIDGSVYTTGNQTYANDTSLVRNATYDSSSGNISLKNIDGSFDFTVVSGGTTNLNNDIGISTPLNSLSVTANTINFSGNNIKTVSDQTYAGPLVLSGATTLTMLGNAIASPGTITIANGATGGTDLFLESGPIGNFGFSVAGTLSLDNLTVTGNTNSNTLTFDTNTALNWQITGANVGNLTVPGVTNNVNFSSIQNLSGVNQDNTFTFADGSRVSGTVDGGSLTHTNTIDFSAFLTQVNIVLSGTNSGTASSGALAGARFTNVTNLLNNGLANEVTLPNKNNNQIQITAANVGSINDPILFDGLQVFRSLSGNDTVTFSVPAVIKILSPTSFSAEINGITMLFLNFSTTTPTPSIPITPVINTPVTSLISSSSTNNNVISNAIYPIIEQSDLVNNVLPMNIENIFNDILFKVNREQDYYKIYCTYSTEKKCELIIKHATSANATPVNSQSMTKTISVPSKPLLNITPPVNKKTLNNGDITDILFKWLRV